MNSNPNPGFVSLCKESRFVFPCPPATGHSFLESLSQELGNSIHSVAILSECLRDDELRRVLTRPDSQTHSPFVASLRSRLPKLQEISVFVPENLTVGIYGHYHQGAIREMIEMLEDSNVKVVRLLYYDLVNIYYISRHCMYAGFSITPRSCVGRSTLYGTPKYRVDMERNATDLGAVTIARLTK
jgi:hypothetical protein